jgi:ferritin-like metal-binding protein YciE
MSSVATLREHLVDELNDLLNAEQQLIEALPQMADKASAGQLKAAIRSHLAETREHEKRAARALKELGEKASGKTCEAMEGLLSEGEELMSGAERGALLDAMLITAAQKVEHYEIATYGTVRTYAEVLGEKAVARLLEQTLRQEKAADRKLTTIAEGSVNRRAAKEWHAQAGAVETASKMLNRGAEWVGSTVGTAVNAVQASDRGRAKNRRSPKARSSNRGRSSGSRSRRR